MGACHEQPLHEPSDPLAERTDRGHYRFEEIDPLQEDEIAVVFTSLEDTRIALKGALKHARQ
jgi:hypothetical protein